MVQTTQGFVYFVAGFETDETFGMMKVGFATDWRQRISNLQTALPFNLEILGVYPGTRDDEKRVHRLLKADHVKREWFRFSDAVEDLIYDLQDAATLLEWEHGEDYKPSLVECLDYQEAGRAMDEAFSAFNSSPVAAPPSL